MTYLQSFYIQEQKLNYLISNFFLSLFFYCSFLFFSLPDEGQSREHTDDVFCFLRDAEMLGLGNIS